MAEELEPGLVRIIAPNPSPMTEAGTNTYLLRGPEGCAVIDPGPDDESHLQAILAAATGPVRQILVSHAHLDHSALVPRLAAATGAPVLAYGDAAAGRSPRMESFTDLGGGEGVDASFRPDEVLADGTEVETPAGPLRAIWTPGHFGNHLAFAWNGVVFSGDLVMGWASTFVSPPDGDLADFRESCRKLADLGARRLHPGHGAPVEDPASRIDWLLNHRASREAQIREALFAGPATPAEIAERVYTDIAPRMIPAATRNVLAHLIDLNARDLAASEDPISPTSRFTLREV